MTPGQAIQAVEAYTGRVAKDYRVESSEEAGVIVIAGRYLGGWRTFEVTQPYTKRSKHGKLIAVPPTAEHVEETE